jgi:hypothetical protein
MSTILETKPEPISAKPNWNYNAYFLAQLERIHPERRLSEIPKQPGAKNTSVGDGEFEVEAESDTNR